jgi:hypothetical protein
MGMLGTAVIAVGLAVLSVRYRNRALFLVAALTVPIGLVGLVVSTQSLGIMTASGSPKAGRCRKWSSRTKGAEASWVRIALILTATFHSLLVRSAADCRYLALVAA